VFSHQAFANELGGLPYELIGDFERKMVTAYGVRRDDVEGYSGMAKRSVFIIDRQGMIRWTWERSREEPLPDYDAVIAEATIFEITGGAASLLTMTATAALVV